MGRRKKTVSLNLVSFYETCEALLNGKFIGWKFLSWAKTLKFQLLKIYFWHRNILEKPNFQPPKSICSSIVTLHHCTVWCTFRKVCSHNHVWDLDGVHHLSSVIINHKVCCSRDCLVLYNTTTLGGHWGQSWQTLYMLQCQRCWGIQRLL